jgi:hypothetical protein
MDSLIDIQKTKSFKDLCLKLIEQQDFLKNVNCEQKQEIEL